MSKASVISNCNDLKIPCDGQTDKPSQATRQPSWQSCEKPRLLDVATERATIR